MATSNAIHRPPRFVCTKCVRNARLVFYDQSSYRDGWFVAVECCERIVGFVNSEAIYAANASARALTTDRDIERIDDPRDRAKQYDLAARGSAHRAALMRWAAGDERTPPPPPTGEG